MINAERQQSHSQNRKAELHPKVWSILARFATAGAVCFLLSIVIMWLGTEILHFNYMGVFAFSWAIVLVTGFSLHRNWTFRATATKTIPQFFRYVVVNIGQILSSSLLMFLIVDYGHFAPWKASALIAALFAVINFFVHKNWSFTEKKQKAPVP